MNIAVFGTGYVGLVTGVTLSEIGHNVVCVDLDEEKVDAMNKAQSPIYEPGIEEYLKRNVEAGRLSFTTEYSEGLEEAEVAYIAVGTPEREDGTADLRFIESVAEDLAMWMKRDMTIVTKSTVPVGTNDWIRSIINSISSYEFTMVSNPEFLREGQALHDAFHGDRIVFGVEDEQAGETMRAINAPFELPMYVTDIRSAEMIKYAANAFLATKISYINDIALLCENLGANVHDVAAGMGMDERIGRSFLNAGIGYGGSCFPKDTSALVTIADQVGQDFSLLKEVINTNDRQRNLLADKAKERLGSLRGKKIAVLGLAFKPETDDMREAASIPLIESLVLAGADVYAYDPIAEENARRLLPEAVNLVESKEEALAGAEAACLVTEWQEFKEIDLRELPEIMEHPILLDGRNVFSLEAADEAGVEYHSIGRPVVHAPSEEEAQSTV
ncbi:UDP-glucose dehydrogenase family protein [Salsuginibacillus kocurii]|uniref:UDP-glucose dehydrogenase family protein n=1 Tax=Salsuginibacillus kocurii TaxID=427078 RepID=UPI000364529C|nr:UDP-glucose/GDP-mannose dehydrogenase family protein [Salsuginibacillus kocurii]